MTLMVKWCAQEMFGSRQMITHILMTLQQCFACENAVMGQERELFERVGFLERVERKGYHHCFRVCGDEGSTPRRV